MFYSRKEIWTSFILAILSFLLAGWGAEKGIPLAVEKIGGAPPAYEKQAIPLDAGGFINGKFAPAQIPSILPQYTYPVSYVGSWAMLPVTGDFRWFTVMSDQPGATVTVTSSASRVIFDFWDYEMYQNPGVVQFNLDGASKGSFSLARKDPSGQKINDYAIITGKTGVSTITMSLTSGRVVITGYLLVFP